jgi:hypothetical protein
MRRSKLQTTQGSLQVIDLLVEAADGSILDGHMLIFFLFKPEHLRYQEGSNNELRKRKRKKGGGMKKNRRRRRTTRRGRREREKTTRRREQQPRDVFLTYIGVEEACVSLVRTTSFLRFFQLLFYERELSGFGLARGSRRGRVATGHTRHTSSSNLRSQSGVLFADHAQLIAKQFHTNLSNLSIFLVCCQQSLEFERERKQITKITKRTTQHSL